MPGRDGTVPLGRGPIAGRGRGGAGPAGNCICPSCGIKVLHKAGQPCAVEKCPKCGSKMIRE
jgi:DNA-directed RNA polymerase subunit RPC12/RpoP